VKRDGRPHVVAQGVVFAGSGEGAVGEPRMYQLVRQPGLVAARDFEIAFHDPGVSAYVFTFG